LTPQPRLHKETVIAGSEVHRSLDELMSNGIET
jgi:hypothetical protein